MKKGFSWKVCVSLCLAISFLYIGITGVLSYGMPYSGTLSALHTLFGFLFVIASLLHIKNNWKALMSYLRKSPEKSTGYRKEFLVSVLICLLLTFGGVTRIPPLGIFLDIGYQLRTAQKVEEESYQRISTRLEHSNSGQHIIIDLRKGSQFSHKVPLFLGMSYTVVPQVAIWVEDTQGNYLETLYVTDA